MTQEQQPKKVWQKKHFWYSISPLLATLLLFGYINLFGAKVSEQPIIDRPATAVSARPTTLLSSPTRSPIQQATILPSPTPTTTPRPNLVTTAAITLLGPPPESGIPTNGRSTFYWRFSEPLLPGQHFVLTLRQNERIIIEETVAQANLGDGFQLLLDLEAAAILPGTAVWQVQLEWADTQTPLLSSETRTLILLEKEN